MDDEQDQLPAPPDPADFLGPPDDDGADLSALAGADPLNLTGDAAPGAGEGERELARELAALRQHLAEVQSQVRRLQEQQTPRSAASSTFTPVVVKITGSASGGGKYNGRILTGASTAVATGNLAMPEGLTVPGADDALVLNAYESGAATHDLAASSYWPGVTCGTSAGKTVVLINGLKVNPC